jgi:hypothetical protein
MEEKMKLQEIKAIAKSKGVKDINIKKADLIRTIQKAEGNFDCFGSIKANECRQMTCLWREDCLITA